MHYVVITFLSLALLLAVVAQGPLMECCNNQNLFRRVFGTPSGRLRFARLTAPECATDALKGSLRSGAGSPFCRGERFASECVSFAPHFHEFLGF